jgi:hypothetical protein
MNKRQKIEVIVELLSQVLSGDITPEAAQESWPDQDKTDDRLIKNAWHSLYHYSIDDDIRAKDQGYAERQRRALEEIVLALKQNLP